MYSCNLYGSKIFLGRISKIVFIIASILFFPSLGQAASLSFVPSTGSYEVGSTFTVGIQTGSMSPALNAVSGVVAFPSDLLEVTSISKGQSIISLWVQEPSFSNSAGTINFEGIVLNPGYTGTNGRVLTVTFKVKVKGVATLSFAAGSVLANDGEGSEILSNRGTAKYQLVVVPEVVSVDITPQETVTDNAGVSVAGELPAIESFSHAMDSWSNSHTGSFDFVLPADVISMRLLVNDKPDSVPVVSYTPPIASREIKDLEEGVSYLHVQYKTVQGWGPILHYKLKIDTQSPESFAITELAPSIFLFEASDSMSGISHYEIKIDGGEVVKFVDDGKHIYRAPELSAGLHNMEVKAFDAAGNFTAATTSFEVVSTASTSSNDAEIVCADVFGNKLLTSQGTALIGILHVVGLVVGSLLLLMVMVYLFWQFVTNVLLKKYTDTAQSQEKIINLFATVQSKMKADIEILDKAKTKRKLTREETRLFKSLKKNLAETEQLMGKDADVVESI